MVGMEDVADVHRAFHVFTGFIAGDEPDEIGGLAEAVVRLQNLLALAQAMEGGNDHRHLRDDLNGFLPDRLKVVLCLGLGIKATQSTDAGAEGVHRGGVSRQGLEHINHASGQVAAGAEFCLERGKFVGVGQMAAMQQVHHFLEGRLLGEVVDVVAAIDQFTDLTTDIAQVGLRGHHGCHALVDGICRFAHSHSSKSPASGVKAEQFKEAAIAGQALASVTPVVKAFALCRAVGRRQHSRP